MREKEYPHGDLIRPQGNSPTANYLKNRVLLVYPVALLAKKATTAVGAEALEEAAPTTGAAAL